MNQDPLVNSHALDHCLEMPSICSSKIFKVKVCKDRIQIFIGITMFINGQCSFKITF